MISEYYKIRIGNVPLMDDLRMKLLKVLNKEIRRFGPIAKLTIVKYEFIFAYVRYQDESIHERVVRFFTNENPIVFYGSTLFFEFLEESKSSPKTATTGFTKAVSSLSELQKRQIIIINLPDRPRLRDELLSELEKDEHMFGSIRQIRIHKTLGNCILAFLEYTDPRVHIHVIKYYNQISAKFLGVPIYFEPAYGYNIDLLQNHKKYTLDF